jgi:hypothetical protein
MTLSVYSPNEDSKKEEIRRPVSLTNEEWGVLRMCVDAYATTHRVKSSEIIATYVTRGQIDEAIACAKLMNDQLQILDKLQSELC